MFRLEEPPPARSASPPRERGAREDQAEPARPGKPIELARIGLALRRAKLVLVGTGLLGVGLGVALGRTVAPVEFASHATLLWEPDQAEQADRTRAEKTLIDSMELPSILWSIRERLGLPMSIAQVGARIEVTTTNQSNVLVLVAKAADGASAQRLGDAAIGALLDARTDLHRARAVDDLARLDADLGRARDAASAARAELTAFRREHRLVDLPSETEHAIREAARLRSEAHTAQADAAAESARADSLRKMAGAEPERTVLSERIVHPGAVNLAEVRVQRAKLGAELSDTHPNVLALDAASAALGDDDAGSATAEQTVGRNPRWDAVQGELVHAEADERAQKTRHEAYSGLAEAADDRVRELGEVEGRAATLLATVRAAESRLGDLEATRAVLADGAGSPRSGLRVLADADLPTQPSKSLRKAFAIATPLAAVLLALASVLVRALWGLKVHTANEVAYHAGFPVLATSAWPIDRDLHELAIDLADARSSATVPSSDRPERIAVLALSAVEVDLTEKLVRRLARVSRRDASSRAETPTTITTTAHPLSGHHPEARRVARRADKLLVVVRAGAHSAFAVRRLRALVGRSERIGLVLVGARPEYVALSDRVGEADAFWRGPCSA